MISRESLLFQGSTNRTNTFMFLNSSYDPEHFLRQLINKVPNVAFHDAVYVMSDPSYAIPFPYSRIAYDSDISFSLQKINCPFFKGGIEISVSLN